MFSLKTLCKILYNIYIIISIASNELKDKSHQHYIRYVHANKEEPKNR